MIDIESRVLLENKDLNMVPSGLLGPIRSAVARDGLLAREAVLIPIVLSIYIYIGILSQSCPGLLSVEI